MWWSALRCRSSRYALVLKVTGQKSSRPMFSNPDERPKTNNYPRVVPGTPASVLAALDATMQRDEVLVLKRRFPERLQWEAQHGFVGRLRRRFYQRPGGVGSRVDVEAEMIGRARDRRRIDAAQRRALAALEVLG